MSNAKSIGKKIHVDIESKLLSYPRGHSKSVLQGMDFGKLEQIVLAIAAKNKGKLQVSSPTLRSIHDHQKDMYREMFNAMQRINAAQLRDEVYTPPASKLQTDVHKIIDDFWDLRCCSLGELYLKQKERNSKTKDLFKGKSTTHHYPWYKRGSNY